MTIKRQSKRSTVSFKGAIKRTKPEFGRESNINNIVKRPLLPQPDMSFADLSNIPSFEAAFVTVQKAQESFMSLPATVRKLIDNDPRKLVSFINDPANTDLLIKHGLLKPKKAPEIAPKSDLQASPPVGSPKASEAE